MRQAFKQKLIEIIPALQGRVYDVQPPSQTAEEPYAVMALGEEIWKSSWAGYRQVVRSPDCRAAPGTSDRCR
ncbi:hypothetical protein [Paenibacillus polymyxa]|uniref:hypothetical protein n=1 Tax=Paenibacillus polymyxa TaxID=1406 RepID=UPI000B197A8D|nr:hypothetical protein [Paenibacillus polymyxa]